MAWRVEFFVDAQGRAPVEEFLTSLPIQHRAKALALIKMLEQEGPRKCSFTFECFFSASISSSTLSRTIW